MSADRGVMYRNMKWPIDGSYDRHLYTFSFPLLAWMLGVTNLYVARSLIGQYHNLVLAPNTARVRA